MALRHTLLRSFFSHIGINPVSTFVIRHTVKHFNEFILLDNFSLLLDKISHDHTAKTQVYGVAALTAKALMDSADHYTAIDETLLL